MSNNKNPIFVTITTDEGVPPDELAQLPYETQAALLNAVLRQRARDKVLLPQDCRTSLQGQEPLAQQQNDINSSKTVLTSV